MDNTTTKEINLPSQGVRVPQGTADEPGVVPARPPSSSDVGLAEVLSAGSSVPICAAEIDDKEYENGHDYGNDSNDEGLNKEGEKKEERESNEDVADTRSQDAAIGEEPPPPPMHAIWLPDSMDTAECRKRVREKTPEEDEEEIRPSQKLRKERKRTLRDSPNEIEDERVQSVHPIEISDDDEEVEFVMDSHSGADEDECHVKEVRRGPGRPRKTRRKAMGVREIEPREYSGSDGDEGYSLLSTSEMGATGIACVERIDCIRKTCGNIKGNLSGEMKKKLQDTREIIKGLVRKSNKRKDGGGDEEIKQLRKRNKELLLELQEKEKNNIKRLEEIGKLRETVQEMKAEIKKMQEMKKGMERMQERIKELEQRSPKRKRKVRGSDADVESDATVCSVQNKPTQSIEWDLPVDTDVGNVSPRLGPDWMIDRGPKRPSASPRPEVKILEKKRESIETLKRNREKIKKDGTLGTGKVYGKMGEREEEWPALPPPAQPPPSRRGSQGIGAWTRK